MVFTLPPEANDRLVTVTIPKEVDGYFKQWYLETKKSGETPEQFAYRKLAKAGMAYRLQKITNDEAVAVQAVINDIKLAHDTTVLESGLE